MHDSEGDPRLHPQGHGNTPFVEPLFCSQGCINGPGIGDGKNIFDRRREIIEYNRETHSG